ncbi:MAG: hypothetical protein KF723_23175 [Rhizobiaceae bacterium]|nr:hypothetical protein [Rhizobiaceae bacterium]
MRLVDNWRRVAARAWSVRLIAAATVLSGIEAAAPYAIDGMVPDPRARAAAIGLLTLAAGVARLVAQKDVSRAEPKERHENVDEDQN